MLDYIYMTNLPAYIYILYFILGLGLNVISYNIATGNFNTLKTPFFLMFLMFLIGNFFSLIIFPLVSMHIGLYFLISIIIPYAVVWRADF